ncbi:uncharacterized protein LOC100872875 isoform X2 [Apis florea]|uniref:uncharacterized protein LOC100872875 isoform X2 n=1 Tax=Apis florea TaxID=7463 RepID=UPI0006292A59|nr:uncharacterized protein LOC100872875 isoform X2 [Apis florea]
MQCNRCTPASSWLLGPGQGTAIKANHVAPQIRSVFPCTAQEKSPTMKFVIVLFAAMAVASAYPGYLHAPVVAQPWPAPEAWPAPAYVKVPQASYYKVAAAPIVKVSAPQVTKKKKII